MKNPKGKEEFLEHDELSVDWIAENFEHRESDFYKELMNAEPGTVVSVPLGSSRNITADTPDRLPDAPAVMFEQSGEPTCVICSLSSAVYASGKDHICKDHLWVA